MRTKSEHFNMPKITVQEKATENLGKLVPTVSIDGRKDRYVGNSLIVSVMI